MADRTTDHPEPDADIEQQLRVGLAELVRTAPDPTHRDLDLDDAPDPHPDHGRRRFLVGAGVATVAIGAGVGIGVLVRRDRSAPVEVMLGADPDRLAVTTDPAPASDRHRVGTDRTPRRSHPGCSPRSCGRATD